VNTHFLTLDETAHLLEKKSISSVELTRHYLDRITHLEPALHAFITVTADHALQQAKESDERRSKNETKGPLDGIPGVLKDVITTRGICSTAGSGMLDQFIPPYDAYVTSRLFRAGMVLLGKTNLDEFAMGTTTEYSAFGATANPWDTTRTAGGSSGGSAAAVAAGEGVFGLGTDTGGSIRLPASWTGVVGLRPTYGRVSRNGIIAMASSLDQVGTFTRSVRDAAIVMNVIAGHDPADSTSADRTVPDYTTSLRTDLHGVRIGVVKEFFGKGVDVPIQDTIKIAVAHLKSLGAEIVDVSLPLVELALADYCIIVPAEVSTNLERYDGIRYGHSAMADPESRTLLDVYLRSRGDGFGAEAKRRIMLGSYVLSAGYYDAYYAKAQKVRRLIKEQFEKAFQTCDCLVGPTAPTLPFRLGEHADDPLRAWMADVLAVPVNMAGLPGMSIPCGMHQGLPIGLQLIADQFQEEHLFAVASAFEASTISHTQHPSLEAVHG